MIHNRFFPDLKGVFGFNEKRLPADGAVFQAKTEQSPDEVISAAKKRPSVPKRSIGLAILISFLLVALLAAGLILNRRSCRDVTDYNKYAGRISGVGTRLEVEGTVCQPGQEGGQFTCLLEQGPGQFWKLYSEEPVEEGSFLRVQGSFLGTVTYNEKQENETTLPTILVENTRLSGQAAK